ncbi:MAG: hypothetical protein J6J00_04245 [Treponema sp.]|nr:hypothetical protein [Treponema sp.]
MINYRGRPLFGEDSSPHNTSEFMALGGTLLFCILFLLSMIFVKPFPQKPKYKEVQIVLSSTPIVKETEANPAPAAAAPASAPAPLAEPAPVVEKAAPKVEQKVVESPKPKAQPKPAEKPKTKPAEPKKTETVQKAQPKPKTEAPKPAPAPAPKPAPAPVQEEPVQLYQDPMEAFAQQTKKQPKQEFNWDMFDDEAAEVTSSSSQSSQSNQVVSSTPSFEGSAGTAVTEKSPALTSQAVASGASQNNAVSTQTSSALSGITNAKYVGRAVSGVSSETSVKTQASGSGKVALAMSNGSMRALLKPSTPVINLSEAAAATIDNSRTVTIKFRVLEAGNVPRAEISIEPESTLHQLVRDEIRDQVSAWLFESADYSATASFTYKIVKQ